MKNLSKIGMLVFALTVILASCKKEVIGPKGDMGSPGANGANGVVVRNFTNVNPDTYLTSPTPAHYGAVLTIPEITQEVIDNGVVLVSIQQSQNLWASQYVDTLNWYSFPYSVYQNSTTSHTIKYYLSSGKMVIYPSNPLNNYVLFNIKVQVVK